MQENISYCSEIKLQTFRGKDYIKMLSKVIFLINDYIRVAYIYIYIYCICI